jgi:hypothetical protein
MLVSTSLIASEAYQKKIARGAFKRETRHKLLIDNTSGFLPDFRRLIIC